MTRFAISTDGATSLIELTTDFAFLNYAKEAIKDHFRSTRDKNALPYLNQLNHILETQRK